jgi:hypothetical protein
VGFAQPQAPVSWGPIRLLQNASVLSTTQDVFARGDTIALMGGYIVDITHEYAMISVSGNNGQSWSAWRTFLFPDISFFHESRTVSLSRGLFCCATTATGFGFYKSTDLGRNWARPVTSIPYVYPMDTIGDTVMCRVPVSDGVWATAWTADGGVTFSPSRQMDLGIGSANHDIAVSDSFVHIVNVGIRIQGQGGRLWYSRSEWNGTDYSTPIDLSGAYFRGMYTADMEFDRQGNGVIASVPSYDGHGFHLGAVAVYVTSDNGTNWLGPDTLLPTQSADPTLINIRHSGSLWAVIWYDSTHVDGEFDRGGAWYCLSANKGRSWYPRHQAFDDSTGGGRISVDMRGNYLRIYEAMELWNGSSGHYFFQWDGLIHPDTIEPEIHAAAQVPRLLPRDTTISFDAVATDDDSLWQMSVVIKHPARPDSIIVPLSRQANHAFSADWSVPFDTSAFLYYYRAEDMWEHTAVWPDSAVWSFHLQPDTNRPVFWAARPLPAVLHPDSLTELRAQVTDDQAGFPAVAAILHRVGSLDTVTIVLEPITGDQFLTTWRIAADTGQWRYGYRATDDWGNMAVFPDTGDLTFRIESISEASPESGLYPATISLACFPNPFNAVTILSFTLPKTCTVELSVFDVTGRRVRFVKGRTQGSPLQAGDHSIEFDGSDLPSGIYFVRLDAGELSQTRKMVLLR